MTVQRGYRYKKGEEQKRPRNIGTYDAILCGQLVLMAGPTIREQCGQPMEIMRVIDSGLQIKKKTLQCAAWGGHIIQSHQMFIGVCNCQQHLTGKAHVVCRVCIENYDVHGPLMNPTYSIVKDYYEYKPKKKI